jgi:hypothetical protein
MERREFQPERRDRSKTLLSHDLCHLFVIGRDPDRATRIVFDFVRQLVA